MYFYLEWLEKRPSKIILINEQPEKINFLEKFKIKKTEYVLCGLINTNFTEYEKNEPSYTKNQYLSSHLQKCIRRMDSVKSVQTAKHFIDLDSNSFLRRLPIIMLEDVTIHESFPILIWLMIAHSKKFKLKNEIVKWILGVVYYLSIYPNKTFYEKEKNEIEINSDDIILNTLRFRKAYGGMNGDMEMIEYYTQKIFEDKIKIDSTKINIIKYVDNLSKKNWLYQANDFHCNRFILKKVHNLYQSFSEDYIKQLIWIFSSSENKREKNIIIDKEKEKDWKKIEKIVKKIQKSCIYY
jgi:hypothetical protein